MKGERPASGIVEALQLVRPLSQPAVSQHLKVLREAGLVSVRSDGNRRLYVLDPAGIEDVRAWLAALTEPAATFTQPLDALATEIIEEEVDIIDDLFEHRMLLWPEGEVGVRFRTLTVERVGATPDDRRGGE